MKALFALAAGLSLISCESSKLRSYNNNDLQLATGNSAHMACSCLWVMNMPEDFCRAWVKASPDVATVEIDTAAKKVTSSALVSWSATAHYVDDKHGCILE